MATKKKMTRRTLKEPDEFLTLTEKGFRLVKDHFRSIAMGGIAVILVFAGIFFFRMWEENKERRASLELMAAMESYDRANSPYQQEGTPTNYQDALGKLENLAKSFPRTSSGRLALLYKGNIDLKLGEFDKAIQSFQTFLSKESKEQLYQSFALEGLGCAYEGKKDYEKAVQAYQKVVTMGAQVSLGEAYIGLGRCYERLEKNKEALENYRAFLKTVPTSPRTDRIHRKVAMLEK